MPDDKHPGGRPLSYKPEMCDQVIQLMKDGASKTAVAAELGIAKSTLYEWSNKDSAFFIPEFSDAIKRGEALSQLWWEKAGQMAVMGSVVGFSAAAWIFSMKNRFREDYADDHGIKHSGSISWPVGKSSLDE